MANVLDYIDWRGDLTFDLSPFNEVDALIFSWMVYADLKGILPGRMNLWMPLQQAAEVFEQVHDYEAEKKSVSFTKSSATLLSAMARCKRYGQVELGFCREKYDSNNAMQFAAMTVRLQPDQVLVVYRGTDQTLVGWKEDFHMSYLEQIPSQEEAMQYLHEVAQYWDSTILLGGHSKGGNLAIYAAANAPKRIRRQIAAIYNNDGPGFGEHTALDEVGYAEIKDRIHTYVPQDSIIGMLLEHGNEYQIVKSDQKGIQQHDALSWQVLGTHFIMLDNTSFSSQVTEQTLSVWLEQMDNAEKEVFIDGVFSLLEATGARTLTELVSGGMKNISIAVHALKDMSKEERSTMVSVLSQLFKTGNDVLKKQLELELPEALSFLPGSKSSGGK